MKLFCEEGFQQTSTARISKEAGVGTGTLFNYFKSKDELIIQIYLESKMSMEENILPKTLEIKEEMEQIRALWRESVYWSLDNVMQHRFIKLFKSSAYFSKVAEHEGEFAQVTHQLFQRLLSKKTIDLPDHLIIQLFLNSHGTLVDHLSLAPEKDHRKMIDDTFIMFLNGLKLKA